MQGSKKSYVLRYRCRKKRKCTVLLLYANKSLILTHQVCCIISLSAQSRALWRRGVHEASSTPWRLWTLERWARLRSHLPPASLKIASLRPPPDGGPPATTADAKAALLADRFFPTFQPSCYRPAPPPGAGKEVPLSQEVDPRDVTLALPETEPWKAAGPDGLPAGMRLVCLLLSRRPVQRMPSARALARDIQTCHGSGCSQAREDGRPKRVPKRFQAYSAA